MTKGTKRKNLLNGSAESFTKALRALVRESAQEAVAPLCKDVKTMDKNIKTLAARVAQVKAATDRIERKAKAKPRRYS